MRGHWKPGGVPPPHTPLFLLETGVSSLCPVPCSKNQEERQSGVGTDGCQEGRLGEQTWRAGACLPRAHASLPGT